MHRNRGPAVRLALSLLHSFSARLPLPSGTLLPVNWPTLPVCPCAVTPAQHGHGAPIMGVSCAISGAPLTVQAPSIHPSSIGHSCLHCLSAHTTHVRPSECEQPFARSLGKVSSDTDHGSEALFDTMCELVAEYAGYTECVIITCHSSEGSCNKPACPFLQKTACTSIGDGSTPHPDHEKH